MILQDIKKTKHYGRTDGCTDNVKTVYPPQTKFAGGIINEPCHEISNSGVCVTSKTSDQPAHTRSLIKAFACRLNILSVKLLTEHHFRFLSLKGGCTGSSESTRVPHCWKSHVAAQIMKPFQACKKLNCSAVVA